MSPSHIVTPPCTYDALTRDAWSPWHPVGDVDGDRGARLNGNAYNVCRPTTRRLGVLVNQSAGRFARLGKLKLERLVREANLTRHMTLVYCDGASLKDQARKLAQSGVDAVAVYGGDGSARSVIDALSGLGIPVLPLPGGTLNRLCHRVHGHAQLIPILANLAMARPVWLSGGRANEHLFLVASGFGPWMGFEQVREVMRYSGLAAGISSLRSLRQTLFKAQLQLQGLADPVDIIIAAPGRVDGAFGLGKDDPSPASWQTLEVGAARLSGPISALGLGGQVLANAWRNSSNVSVLTGREMMLVGTNTQSDTHVSSEICGLVDGELCKLGSNVRLTYQPRAAWVLTTR